MRHTILQNARQESNRTAQAIAFHEMLICEDALHIGDVEKSAAEGDLLVVGIGQRLLRNGGVVHRGENELAQHRQTRAGAANRDTFTQSFINAESEPACLAST